MSIQNGKEGRGDIIFRKRTEGPTHRSDPAAGGEEQPSAFVPPPPYVSPTEAMNIFAKKKRIPSDPPSAAHRDEEDGSDEMAEALEEVDIEVDVSSESGANSTADDPLSKAESIYLRDCAEMQRMHAAGEDLNAPNEAGNTALQRAVFRGHTALVEMLLVLGADPTVSTPEWTKTPLDLALESGNREILDVLARYGAREDEEKAPGRCEVETGCNIT
jgi:ankyrin repeat protein